MRETLKRHTKKLYPRPLPSAQPVTHPSSLSEAGFGGHSLTSMELVALSGLNVADGHPRHHPSPAQLSIIKQLPEIFEQTREADFFDIERATVSACMSLLGQGLTQVAEGRFATAYSSSVLIDVVGRSLSAAGVGVIGLVHPTFDNIPDLLRSRGHQLVAIDEESLSNGALPAGIECVFITSPNNPTGWVLERPAYEAVVRLAANRGVVVVHDASFRGFDPRSQFDCCAILERAGGDYVVIEDTGKLWPMQELKVGFCLFGGRGHRDLRIGEHLSDVLLTVSPVILRLIELLAVDAARGGLDALRELVMANRLELANVVGSRLVDADSRISVARLETADDSQSVYEGLVRKGVHVLPCGPFYWHDHSQGAHSVRVALARDSQMFAEAAQRIASFLDGR